MEVREIRSAGAFSKAKNHELAVIDFGAPWSEACRLQDLILQRLAFQLGDRACIATVNIDRTPDLAWRFGIQVIPTLVIFHKGREVQRFVGLHSEDILLAAINRRGAHQANLKKGSGIKEVMVMPRGDGTGPRGQGPGTGRGMGRSGGKGRGGGFGAGPGGDCVCPNCGERLPHRMGSPCYERKCPKCGTAMTRG